jgi:UDP-glucose:(heptosyl)LPS alpha-1,3-glucosyltransferase
MKIALIRKEFMDWYGGAERYAVSLARGLAVLGHSVHVFAGKCDNKQQPDITIHKVPFIPTPSSLKNLSFQRNVRKLLAGHDFDIVNGLSQVFPQDVYRLGDGLHVHWLRIQTPNPGKRLLKYLSPRHQVILSIERQIFKNGNYRRIIANSLMCKNQLIHYYGVPEDNIRLVYNGVDLKRFNQGIKDKLADSSKGKLGISERDTVLLFVGHNFKRKGLQFAIQCAIALKAQGHRVKLLVAGRGNPAPFLRIAGEKGFSDDVTFLGHAKNIEEVYAASDILIHPVLYDPFSNVCLEAMACGLPVLTTKFNGASEIIGDACTGLVVDSPWDVEKMVSGISPLLEDRRTRLRAMSESTARLAQGYSVEKNIKKTVEVYEEVLREKGISR